MREQLRRLAAFESPDGAPVLSAYLDMRPQVTGQDPGLRSGEVVLKDRLREIERTLGPRGAALDSFRADAERVQQYLDEETPGSSQGVAVFACSAHDLFETVHAGVAFENRVGIGPKPDLFQLARLLDDQETSVVAVVDSNTARLFVSRTGFLEERRGLDEDPKYYRRQSLGGWSQNRYQRHNANQRAWFAGEVASEIQDLVSREGAGHILLAGDEVAIPLLQDALPPQLRDMVHKVIRIHIRTPLEEIEEEVRPLLMEAESEESRSVADRLVDAVLSDGLGVAGPDQTKASVALGEADILVLDPEAGPEGELREELVRLATNTGASVEVVEDHEGFQRLGGVGALLRFRH